MKENKIDRPNMKDLHGLYVKGLEDELENRVKHLIEFEKIAIQTAIALNSALLFAAPTIALNINKEKASQISIYPMICFFIGIVTVLASLQLMRMTMGSAVNNSRFLANLWTSKIIEMASGSPHVVDSEFINEFLRAKEKADESERDAMQFSKYAELFGWSSYLFMIAGILVFAYRAAALSVI